MSAPSNHDARRQYLLHEMAIGPTWVRRTAPMPVSEPVAASSVGTAAPQGAASDAVEPVAIAPSAWDQQVPVASGGAAVTTDAEIAGMDWDALKTAVAACQRCPLCATRRRTVFGTGDLKARWLLVGEGPGRNEDRQGEPFVGPAGKLLDNMLKAIDLRRGENNYIANVVKCRPVDQSGNDRPPTAEEAAACRPYLNRQIALLKPLTIVALGKIAALSLLGSDPKTPVADLRGIVHRCGNIPLVVTYHPAYLLRKPLDKAKSWQDLCLARQAGETVTSLVD